MLSERDGRIVLREAFESHGFNIQENYRIVLDDFEIELDGYDEKARVGYEYLTREDGIEPEPLRRLILTREYQIFLIDEHHVPNAWVLAQAVLDFFRELERGDELTP